MINDILAEKIIKQLNKEKGTKRLIRSLLVIITFLKPNLFYMVE